MEETKTALAEAMAHTERLTAEAAALGNMKTALAEAEARAERLAAEAAAVGEMRTALAEAQARAEQLEAELAAGAAAAAAVAVPTRDAWTLDHLQRLERVGQLATGVSEDWARLLDTVDEHARALLSTLPSGADEQYNVKRIIEAAERGKPLARQLLAFSRKQTQRPSPLDVNQVLTGMEPLLRQIAGEAIDLSLSLDSPLAAVQADREDLQRAVAALVLLGRDLLPFGGSISLRTAQAASEPGCAGPRGPGVRVELGIDAAGRGMDQAIQERLLRTADAAASPTPTELDSTQKLVADQGGELKVGGEPGWRTTFTLRLPGVRVD